MSALHSTRIHRLHMSYIFYNAKRSGTAILYTCVDDLPSGQRPRIHACAGVAVSCGHMRADGAFQRAESNRASPYTARRNAQQRSPIHCQIHCAAGLAMDSELSCISGVQILDLHCHHRRYLIRYALHESVVDSWIAVSRCTRKSACVCLSFVRVSA